MSLKAQDVYGILNSKIEEGGSGTGGTTNYNNLQNKPKINNVELTGNKTLEDLGIQEAGNYLTEDNLPDIPEIDETLSISGNAADAKVVGDKFTELDGNIEDINENISGIKNDLANTSDAIISEAEGETILVNDSGEKGLSGLKVFGWSKQDGTPSPENPVPIESAGSVMTTGANLFDSSLVQGREFNGIIFTNIGDGSFTVKGTATAQAYTVPVIFSLPPGNYYVSDNLKTPDIMFYCSTRTVGTEKWYEVQNNVLIVTDTDEVQGYINVSANATVDTIIYPMLNAGDTALPWEPYTGGQPGANPYEGEIGVTVQGGNLFNESGTTEVTKDGITVKWLQDEQCFLLNGTATGSGSSSMWNINIPAVKGADYTIGVKYISGNVQVPDGGYAVAYFGTSDELNQSTNWSAADLLNSDSEEVKECDANYITRFWFYITSGVVLNNYKCRVMLNVGSTALPYEPYKQPQTLTLSTPGGLPGIPVTSGGNYTDENGQQWVCDEVDFERGVYVQRIGTLQKTGNFQMSESADAPGRYYHYSGSKIFFKDGSHEAFCNIASWALWGYDGTHTNTNWLFALNSNGYYISPPSEGGIESAEELNNLLNSLEFPVVFVGQLATPIETPLSAEQISAYKVLHTYSPTTTVSNDAGAYMEVEYAKDIEKYINDTTNEIVDSVIDSAIDNYDAEIKSYVDTNYVKKTDLETDQEKLEKYIESYYSMKRNGKVYQTKLWKFATNPTSDGEKLLSNAGLIFSPSTDTTEGQDDYLNGQHPMFEWVNVNYIRDNDGTARPTAIEGMDNYATSGSVDVGVMQMSFYWKWDTSNAEYDLITVSDSPHPELGLEPWPECIKEDGTILPWCIGSKYISGIASDGLLRSQPGLKPERKQSYNNMITNYAKKGEGYFGAGAVRNLFQIVFNIIKGATKSSQTLYQGVTNWNFQYDASVESETSNTYFPVTNSQAENLIVGNYVSVGYGYNNSGELGKDRSTDSLHAYADDVKILSIETLDENNKAVYLDIETGFNTTPVQVTDSLTSPIIMSSMHTWSGMTDSVIGKHDGSPISNTNSKMPYRVQGREYAVGGYIIASDTVMDLQGDFTKNVYVAEKGTVHSSSDSTIKSTYKMVGTIPAAAVGNNADWWVGDIAVDMDTGVWYPSVEGSSNSQGMADRCYAGGSTATSGTREYLQGGYLRSGSNAGSACLFCGHGLSGAGWYCLGCD